MSATQFPDLRELMEGVRIHAGALNARCEKLEAALLADLAAGEAAWAELENERDAFSARIAELMAENEDLRARVREKEARVKAGDGSRGSRDLGVNTQSEEDREYNAYLEWTCEHGLPALSIEQWREVETSIASQDAARGLHADFDAYREGNGEQGFPAVPLEKFTAGWLRIKHGGLSPAQARELMTEIESEHFGNSTPNPAA
jgi:hypothetical protein